MTRLMLPDFAEAMTDTKSVQLTLHRASTWSEPVRTLSLPLESLPDEHAGPRVQLDGMSDLSSSALEHSPLQAPLAERREGP